MLELDGSRAPTRGEAGFLSAQALGGRERYMSAHVSGDHPKG